jgi:hypothetical protein
MYLWFRRYHVNKNRLSEQPIRDYDNKLRDVKEAAEFLCINPRTLQTWVTTNQYPELKSMKLGRLRKFRKADRLEFLESRVQIRTKRINKHKTPKEGFS